MYDKDVAEAAFALPQAGVTQPIPGKFGFVLARVSNVEPGATKSSAPSRTRSRPSWRRTRPGETQNLHDKIEDLRSPARRWRRPPRPSASNRRPSSRTPPAPARARRASPALRSRPSPPCRTGQGDLRLRRRRRQRSRLAQGRGFAWFEIGAIEPSRQCRSTRSSPQAVKALRESEAQKQLAAKANELARKINSGESLAAVAAANGVAVQQAPDVKRSRRRTCRQPPSGRFSARRSAPPESRWPTMAAAWCSRFSSHDAAARSGIPDDRRMLAQLDSRLPTTCSRHMSGACRHNWRQDQPGRAARSRRRAA